MAVFERGGSVGSLGSIGSLGVGRGTLPDERGTFGLGRGTLPDERGTFAFGAAVATGGVGLARHFRTATGLAFIDTLGGGGAAHPLYLLS